jgi:hypothetical protein
VEAVYYLVEADRGLGGFELPMNHQTGSLLCRAAGAARNGARCSPTRSTRFSRSCAALLRSCWISNLICVTASASSRSA